MYIYTYTYIFMHIHLHIYTHVYILEYSHIIYLSTYVCSMHVCMAACPYLCMVMHARMYVGKYVCMHAPVYINTYVYI